MDAFKQEHEALKAEIAALENALEMRRVRVGLGLAEGPKLRALPTPKRSEAAARGLESRNGAEDSPRNLVLAWARAHGGRVVRSEWHAHHLASGRFKTPEQAHAAFGNAISAIQTGFTRESPGVYLFHAIDGQALHAIEDEQEVAS